MSSTFNSTISTGLSSFSIIDSLNLQAKIVHVFKLSVGASCNLVIELSFPIFFLVTIIIDEHHSLSPLVVLAVDSQGRKIHALKSPNYREENVSIDCVDINLRVC